MEVKIYFAGIDESKSFVSLIEEKLTESVTKYFDIAVGAEVYFKKEGPEFLCTIIVNEGVKGGGIEIKGDHQSHDIHSSFSQACEKVEKQLRRYKTKLKNHHAS